MLLSLVLITVYFREPSGGGLHGAQSAGATVLRPFEVVATRVAAPFRDAYGWFSGVIHAKSENARLRAQIEQLRQQAIQNTTAARQVDDLRSELHYVGLPRFPQDFRPVPADVISRPPSEFEQQIGVSAGSSSGIHENDPVVSADGDLVGKVTSVASDSAQVTLLTDPSIQVSALDLQTEAAGLVGHGQGQGTLTLNRVQKSQVLRERDTIVTQGWKVGDLSSLYPAGIPIGYVSGATNSEIDLYWNAQLTPFANFDSLRSVIVLVRKTRAAK